VVVFSVDRRRLAERRARIDQLLRASRRIGARCAMIGSGDLPHDQLDAGAIEVADQPALPATAAALLATALPLQWLAYELAIARGTNPDLIRREQVAYREASQIHG
jgi:fructoselysine-6-P-deglycase FrlB-like protein